MMRFDARGLRGAVELHHRKQIALIGQRNRRHARARDGIHQPDAALAFAR